MWMMRFKRQDHPYPCVLIFSKKVLHVWSELIGEDNKSLGSAVFKVHFTIIQMPTSPKAGKMAWMYECNETYCVSNCLLFMQMCVCNIEDEWNNFFSPL